MFLNEKKLKCIFCGKIEDKMEYIFSKNDEINYACFDCSKKYEKLTNFYCYEQKVGEVKPLSVEENLENKNLMPAVEQNKTEEKNMRELTPKVIQTFSAEERLLFRAGLLNEEKNWTELAKGFSIDMFLNDKKAELVKLAQELINEERENSLGGLLNINKKTE